MSTRTPWPVKIARKYGQSTVLYSALALSAPGEYALAQMAGWDWRVAWLMPAVMSLYAAIGASVATAQKQAARVAVGTPQEAEAKRRSRNATWGALLALGMATAAQITEHILTTGATGARAWVVIVVSAVPPLVAAHVLHIDPPSDEEATDEKLAPEWVREELTRRDQGPAGEPAKTLEVQLPTEPVKEPEKPVLVTYAEAAEALGLSEVTIRGAANSDRLKKHVGDIPNRVYVDMRECHTVFAKSRRPVAA